MSKKPNDNGIEGGFVFLPWKVLNSEAYKNLSGSAAKMLPYFLGKLRGKQLSNWKEPRRYLETFTFSYPEAERYGCTRKTFSRVIEELEDAGFIKCVEHGGLRGKGKGYNKYLLSRDWEKPPKLAPVPKKIKKQDIINVQTQKLRNELEASKDIRDELF